MPTELINKLTSALFASGNQFLTGGLTMMAVGAIVMQMKSFPMRMRNYFLRYFTVVVDVNNSDAAYSWILFWLDQSTYGQKSRRLSIRHISSKRGEDKFLLVPSAGNHWFLLNRRMVWLTRVTSEPKAGEANQLAAALAPPKETITIRVTGRSRSAVTDIIDHAKSLYEKASDDNCIPVVSLSGGGMYGPSGSGNRKIKRSMESVFFLGGGADLVEDMKTFVNNRDWYNKMGIPHRRGYLFYGPPGTGKSTAAFTLACALDLKLQTINLANSSDGQVENAISCIDSDKPSILLMEDIDTVCLERNVEGLHVKPTISLGTLLNALDGVRSPENLILIMTTNHPEKLDPALIRSGRVDRKVEFGLAADTQIEAAVRRFLPNIEPEQRNEVNSWPRPLSMADVQEKLKRMVLGGVECEEEKLDSQTS